MVILVRVQNNTNLFFFLPGPIMPNPFFSQFFPYSPEQLSQFYAINYEAKKDMTALKTDDPPDDQIKEEQVSFVRSKKRERKGKIKSRRKKQEDYIPNFYTEKVKKKTVYEKDKNRNILPNAISKLFFFLKSRTKSQHLLKEILEANQDLSTHLSVQNYYTITSFIKSKMERYKTEKNIELLFKLCDEKFQIFSQQNQLSFIKANAIILRNYIQKQLYLDSLQNSKRISEDKIKEYKENYKKILEIGEKMMEKAKSTFNFSIIQGSSTEE